MEQLKLFDYQLDAVNKMHNGCILCGGVGSGKSITSLAYYIKEQSDISNTSNIRLSKNSIDLPARNSYLQNLYIITTARKRDTCEWDKDLSHFLLSPDKSINYYNNTVVVDSWNNIQKYADITNAFFIFDEQRVVGYGAWSKTFIRIARQNRWILLSATPGDTWSDYIPVFIANGFYRNKTEFINSHVVYSRFNNYTRIDKYIGTKKLAYLRDQILIDMDFDRQTIAHHLDILVDYDKIIYRDVLRNRWNVYNNKPIDTASELCYILRKIINSSEDRQVQLLELCEKHDRIIVFYNFDYELDILKSLDYGKKDIAEWNGHKHQEIPKSEKWIYLVQYTAGAEGWNCISTDTIVFYSQSYSYKLTEQAAGRIDRLNTKYIDLYYYHLRSTASIDIAIYAALKRKKKFNEEKFLLER